MLVRAIASLFAVAVLSQGPLRAADLPQDQAQASAETWLKLVDQGQYETAWRESTWPQSRVTLKEWTGVASQMRSRCGSLVSRKVKSLQSEEQRVVIEYETVFGKRTAVETVGLKLDSKGAWRVSSYSMP